MELVRPGFEHWLSEFPTSQPLERRARSRQGIIPNRRLKFLNEAPILIWLGAFR